LIEARDAKMGENERILAARSFMSHAADPETIYQGQHDTCNVSTLEGRNLKRNPSIMAEMEMITSVAVNGAWTARMVKTSR
jgi:hypothetical protein